MQGVTPWQLYWQFCRLRLGYFTICAGIGNNFSGRDFFGARRLAALIRACVTAAEEQ